MSPARQVLVLCGDQWHPAETVRRGLEPLRDAGFSFRFFEDGAAGSAAQLSGFRLVVLAKVNAISATDKRPWLTPDSSPRGVFSSAAPAHQTVLTPRGEAAFCDFVRRGNGLVVVHGGIAGYDRLPAMRGLTGGVFLRHPPQCAVTIEPRTDHPLTGGVGLFTVTDEHYEVALDDPHADVFLRSHSEHGAQPAGWIRLEGSGRVCVLTPGHNAEVWLHPSFQTLLRNALRWAASS